jgi:hypothetical protein
MTAKRAILSTKLGRSPMAVNRSRCFVVSRDTYDDWRRTSFDGGGASHKPQELRDRGPDNPL